MAKKVIDVVDINFNQKHKVEVEESDIPTGIPTAEQLAEVIEGSETVVVDVSESGDKLEVHLDADVVAKVDNSLQLPLSHTETKVVAVDNAGSQKMLGIGTGIKVKDNKLTSYINEDEVVTYDENDYDDEGDYFLLNLSENKQFSVLVKNNTSKDLEIKIGGKFILICSNEISNNFDNIMFGLESGFGVQDSYLLLAGEHSYSIVRHGNVVYLGLEFEEI